MKIILKRRKLSVKKKNNPEINFIKITSWREKPKLKGL